jgi:hypothetical protein
MTGFSVKHCLIAVAILFSNPFACQVSYQEMDTKYTPNATTVCNNLLKKNNSSTGTGDQAFKNNIQFCVTALMRQKLLFLYDFDLGKGFTISAGVGKAFGKDVFQNGYLSFNRSSLDTKVLDPGNIFLYSTYSGSSPLLQAGLKLYFDGSSFDGGYVNVLYRHEVLNYTLNTEVGTFPVNDPDNSVSFKMNAFSFGFGFTSLTGNKDNLTHDFFINIGIKYFSYTTFEQFSNPGFIPEYRRQPFDSKAKIMPAVNIGYNFGFGF